MYIWPCVWIPRSILDYSLLLMPTNSCLEIVLVLFPVPAEYIHSRGVVMGLYFGSPEASSMANAWEWVGDDGL